MSPNQQHSSGDPDRRNLRPFRVIPLQLSLPGVSDVVIAAIHHGGKNVDPNALRSVGYIQSEDFPGDVEDALHNLREQKNQDWVVSETGSCAQRITNLSEYWSATPPFPLQRELCAITLVATGAARLASDHPDVFDENYFPELVSVLMAMSLVARDSSKDDSKRVAQDLYLGLLISELSNYRATFSQEPKEQLIEKLIRFSAHDARLPSQIAFLSVNWESLHARFDDFIAKYPIALPFTSQDEFEQLTFFFYPEERPDSDFDGQQSFDDCEEENQQFYTDLLEELRPVGEAISKEPYWESPFSWDLASHIDSAAPVLLNIHPLPSNLPPDVKFPSHPPSAALASVLTGTVSMGVTEWRFLVSGLALNGALLELDASHHYVSTSKLFSDLNDYLSSRRTVSLSTFLGCSRGRSTPHIDEIQDWLDGVRALAEQSSERGLGNSGGVTVKLVQVGEDEVFASGKGNRKSNFPMVIGDFWPDVRSVPFETVVLDFLRLESNTTRAGVHSHATLLQLIGEDLILSGKVTESGIYGVEQRTLQPHTSGVASRLGFQLPLLVSENYSNPNYTLLYLSKPKGGDEDSPIDSDAPYEGASR